MASARRPLFWIALGLLLLAACTAGPNPLVGHFRADGAPAGFWLGWWHGAISPITFVVSLFSSNVAVYEVFNTGRWYDLGFGLGVLCALSGTGGGAAARSRSSREARLAAKRARAGVV